MQEKKAQNSKLLIRIVHWVLDCIDTYINTVLYSHFYSHIIVFLGLGLQVIVLKLVITLLIQLVERSLRHFILLETVHL